jgi:hypothetical protein
MSERFLRVAQRPCRLIVTKEPSMLFIEGERSGAALFGYFLLL